MSSPPLHQVDLPCDVPGEALAYLTDKLGFQPEQVFPADDPAVAVVSGHGLRLRLARKDAGELPSPSELPALSPELIVHPCGEDWVTGRAGMRYRDLLPGRLGGHVIASHIAIPDGGPVPDRVHYHELCFQLIHCLRGWVRVLYEDQGEAIVMRAGDGVLQPPGMRHRVLEASSGLEVFELGAPAVHLTGFDNDLELPTPQLDQQRAWAGQRFVFYRAEQAQWGPWRAPGFRSRGTGIGQATGGRAEVRVVGARVVGAGDGSDCAELPDCLRLLFVAAGEAKLSGGQRLTAGGLAVLPAGSGAGLAEPSPDLELIEVAFPLDPCSSAT